MSNMFYSDYRHNRKRMSGRMKSVLIVGTVAAVVSGIIILDDPDEDDEYPVDTVRGCQIQGDDGEYYRVEDHHCNPGEDGNPPGNYSMFFVSGGSGYHVPPYGGRLDKAQTSRAVAAGKAPRVAPAPAAGGPAKSVVQRGGLGANSGAKGSSSS
jgi:hypothetical protein